MPIKILFNILMLLSLTFVFGAATACASIILLDINCNGKIIERTLEGHKIIKEKGFMGDVQRGFLFNKKFFAIDHNDELVVTSFMPTKTKKYEEFNLAWHKSLRFWKVISVDQNRIVISARKEHIETNTDYYFFKFDRHENLFSEIKLKGCINDYVSIFRDAIYYTNEDGNICVFDSGIVNLLGIKGTSPSISPDGTKLSYISFGIAFESIYIYDLETHKTKSIYKSFGPNSLNPKINWSIDSLSFAFRKQSDITTTSLFIFDAVKGKKINEFKKNTACNWFLLNISLQ